MDDTGGTEEQWPNAPLPSTSADSSKTRRRLIGESSLPWRSVPAREPSASTIGSRPSTPQHGRWRTTQASRRAAPRTPTGAAIEQPGEGHAVLVEPRRQGPSDGWLGSEPSGHGVGALDAAPADSDDESLVDRYACVHQGCRTRPLSGDDDNSDLPEQQGVQPRPSGPAPVRRTHRPQLRGPRPMAHEPEVSCNRPRSANFG